MDACDPVAAVAITNVVSNQPPLGGGQGNTNPDVLFGKKAFCIRAERQGTSSSPRTYTVTLGAKDFAGNTSAKSVSVVVNPNQSGMKCPNVNPARLVDDSDPRCTAN